jgi:mannose-6-phosphate isomerase-like protein (cupin superfamily)
MTIEIIKPVDIALQEKQRTKVMNSRKMHAWVHYYPDNGDHDEMHCHNQDQTFTCFQGQCTMHFPDGGKAVLDPGTVALIKGGSFYQLENTGDGPMIMMGTRSGDQNDTRVISYETRKDVAPHVTSGKVKRLTPVGA